MIAKSFSCCFYTAALVHILCVFPGEGAEVTDTTGEYSDASDPWETPVQELQRVTQSCEFKIPDFAHIAYNAEAEWQRCIDTIHPKFPILESTRSRSNAPLNDTVIREIDRQLYMAICRNTTAYRGCWLSVIGALNKCEQGAGDISDKIYFALYEDICRDGGRITVENRRRAAAEGSPCLRNYATKECSMIKLKEKMRHSSDLCIRFQSNTACDLSSIDRNCSNKVDKQLHAEIFERVGQVLNCTSSPSEDESNGANRLTGYSYMFIAIILIFVSNINKFN
ncbi:hypothetical protein Ocin01_13905 [Orchesella cincta]|uniref:Secreted protein n=1 Tax=Orchesella cincta TaxID=48709 RepID=A0A1D2MIF2_ORCCI|nr:hypothetical protein Ocin01_13905 [Orchesella cincta]